MDEVSIRLIARRLAARARRADQGEMDTSWFETDAGIELEETWGRLKEADKRDDPDRVMTFLQILSKRSLTLRDEVAESKRFRGDRDESSVRTQRKDHSPRSLKDTMPSEQDRPDERPGPKTRRPPTKRDPRHDTKPSA